jgi:hypothetical protein
MNFVETMEIIGMHDYDRLFSISKNDCVIMIPRVSKMMDQPVQGSLLEVSKERYKAISLPSMDLEDLQEWVESGGDD